jgi:hypothetical protein
MVFSRVWERGRMDRNLSPSLTGCKGLQAKTFEQIFPCESMTPFEDPVVPEV